MSIFEPLYCALLQQNPLLRKFRAGATLRAHIVAYRFWQSK
jgi:hypothetical protein